MKLFIKIYINILIKYISFPLVANQLLGGNRISLDKQIEHETVIFSHLVAYTFLSTHNLSFG